MNGYNAVNARRHTKEVLEEKKLGTKVGNCIRGSTMKGDSTTYFYAKNRKEGLKIMKELQKLGYKVELTGCTCNKRSAALYISWA